MDKYVFIGSYDKTDMLLYIAKTLTILNKKVLIIDTTILQKSRYIVPAMTPTKQYITTFEDVDVAIGFENFAKIKEYQSLKNEEELEYDIALIDIDTSRAYQEYEIKSTDKHYFVTSFDVYCLKRGLSVFSHIKNQVDVTKVLYTKEMLAEEDEYLNFLAMNLKVKWNSEIIFFPFELGDQNVIFANQRTSRIKVRGLSAQYMDSIMFICEEISKLGPNAVKKAVKIIDRN